MAEYFETIYSEIPMQFKAQSKIRLLLEAFAEQLDDIKEFYSQLLSARELKNASGVQLDYIGDILSLSRAEASAISGISAEMDDELYRKFLAYKITLNSSHCTYQDVIDAISMFTKDVAFYREEVDKPATMILKVTTELADILRKFKFSRAAGVSVEYDEFSFETDERPTNTYISYFTLDRYEIPWSEEEEYTVVQD